MQRGERRWPNEAEQNELQWSENRRYRLTIISSIFKWKAIKIAKRIIELPHSNSFSFEQTIACLNYTNKWPSLIREFIKRASIWAPERCERQVLQECLFAQVLQCVWRRPAVCTRHRVDYRLDTAVKTLPQAPSTVIAPHAEACLDARETNLCVRSGESKFVILNELLQSSN